MHVIKQFEP